MENLKQRIRTNSFFYISSVISFLILTAIVFLFPVEFSGYRNTDLSAPIWYLITTTGAFYGGAVIILFLAVYFSFHFKKNSLKKRNALLFVSVVLIIQLLITASSFYFKTVFENPRPSQMYFVEKEFIDKSNKEYFDMTPDDKSKYLQKKIDSNDDIFKDIYPPVLNSWVDDSGYSFPSGHAQTSFFLGTILAFVIYKTNSKKYYIFFPLAWAILVALSRVVIGIHYPVDVTAGAFIGLTAGLIVVSFNKVNQIFV